MNEEKIILEYCDIAAALWYNYIFHTSKQDILIQVCIGSKPDTIHIKKFTHVAIYAILFLLSISMIYDVTTCSHSNENLC